MGQLSRQNKRRLAPSEIKIDDVFVTNDMQKRIDWPLARVKEIFPGRDGNVRVVKLQTAGSELIRSKYSTKINLFGGKSRCWIQNERS